MLGDLLDIPVEEMNDDELKELSDEVLRLGRILNWTAQPIDKGMMVMAGMDAWTKFAAFEIREYNKFWWKKVVIGCYRNEIW